MSTFWADKQEVERIIQLNTVLSTEDSEDTALTSDLHWRIMGEGRLIGRMGLTGTDI